MNQLTNQEKNMLKEQWQKEDERGKELDRQKFILERERNQDLIRHNEIERKLRDEKEGVEKDRDRHMLNNQL